MQSRKASAFRSHPRCCISGQFKGRESLEAPCTAESKGAALFRWRRWSAPRHGRRIPSPHWTFSLPLCVFPFRFCRDNQAAGAFRRRLHSGMYWAFPHPGIARQAVLTGCCFLRPGIPRQFSPGLPDPQGKNHRSWSPTDEPTANRCAPASEACPGR